MNSDNLYDWFRREMKSFPFTEFANQLAIHLGLSFIPEMDEGKVCFVNNNTELRDEYKMAFSISDLSDYVYAIIHSSAYYEKHKAETGIFSWGVKLPKDQIKFWALVKLGSKIRSVHLFEYQDADLITIKYPVAGDNMVYKSVHINEKVFINENQFFENVPEEAWNLFIGGSPAAQDWLLKRKGNYLDSGEIFHFQKIMAALIDTIILMKEVDKIWLE